MKITSVKQFRSVSEKDIYNNRYISEKGFNVAYYYKQGYTPVFCETDELAYKSVFTADIAAKIDVEESWLIKKMTEHGKTKNIGAGKFNYVFFKNILDCQSFIDEVLEPLYIAKQLSK